MEYSDFEILKVVHTSRFFFNSEEQFEDESNGIGESWENIKNNKEDTAYLNRLIATYSSTVFQNMAHMPLREFAVSYINACKLHNDKDFWMGLSKKQRQKFCIHILGYALWSENTPISDNQNNFFGLTAKNYHLLWEAFYPDSLSHKPKLDPYIMALLLFDIIKPIPIHSLETSRRQQFSVEKEKTALSNMIDFLTTLKNNLPLHLPQLLNFEIINSIDSICVNYKETIQTLTAPGNTGILHWLQIYYLGRISISSSKPDIYNLGGVWKDDRNNFWIFPKNNHVALRFEYGFPLKEAKVFLIEQSITKTVDSSKKRWTFHNWSSINPKRFSIGKFQDDVATDKVTLSVSPISDDEGNVSQFNFRKIYDNIPFWYDWNVFFRPSSSEATLFRESLLMTSKELKLSNLGDELSNPDYWLDALLGIDKEYIYVFDQCYLATPTIECNRQDCFTIKFNFNEDEKSNIHSADISSMKPMYIIPRHPQSKYINQDIKDAIDQICWGTAVHILHKAPDGIPRLYIPNFMVSIPLDEETMNLIGIRKVIDPKDFFLISR